MKFGLRSITSFTAAVILTLGTAALGQPAKKPLVAGMYSITNVTNINSQEVELSLQINLFSRTTNSINISTLSFHPRLPVLTAQRTLLPRLQLVASSLALRPGARVNLTKNVIVSRQEYLMSIHGHWLSFVVTVQEPDGTTETQTLMLRANPFMEVR